MNLPTPTPEEVREFAALYQSEFGVALDEEEAWEAATRTLRLFCLGTYGLKSNPNYRAARPSAAPARKPN